MSLTRVQVAFDLKAVHGVGFMSQLSGRETETRNGLSFAKETQMPDPDKIEDAKLFLLQMLEDGPVLHDTLKAEAQAEGHAYRTIERAKTELGIISVRKGFGPGSKFFWSMSEYHQVVEESDF
jgi:hypothetical protein